MTDDDFNWRDYESYVRSVCEFLAEDDRVRVLPKKHYPTISGDREIEIDVSFEAELLGTRILGLGECRYYTRPIEAKDVMAFATVIQRIGANKGIFFTKTGYQSGAIQEADADGKIALAVLSPGASAKPRFLVRGPGERAARAPAGFVRPGGALSARGHDSPHGIRFQTARELFDLLELSERMNAEGRET